MWRACRRQPCGTRRATRACCCCSAPRCHTPRGTDPLARHHPHASGLLPAGPNASGWMAPRSTCAWGAVPQAGDISLRDMWVHQAPPIAWSPLASLTFARQTQLQALAPAPPPAAARSVEAPPPLDAADGVAARVLTWQRVAFHGAAPTEAADGEPTAGDGACHSGDVLLSMRWRASHGYALDAGANVALLQAPIATPSSAEQRCAAPAPIAPHRARV
eukprot:3736707-Prymnesium_polylepis.1